MYEENGHHIINIDDTSFKANNINFTFAEITDVDSNIYSFDNNEVLENLISIMNQKNFSIVLLNEKELNLILTQKVLMKNEQIVFKLFNKEETNDELLYEINLLKEENRILKERLDKIEKTIPVLEKKNSDSCIARNNISNNISNLSLNNENIIQILNKQGITKLSSNNNLVYFDILYFLGFQ